MSKIVLLINNNRSLLLVSGFLARMGCSVDEVTDAGAGLARLAHHDYDIAVLLESPVAASWTTCESIRQISSIPLIVVSLNASTETCVKAIEAGADYFLRKTFGPLELLARIDSLLYRAKNPRPLASAPALTQGSR
jgi:DNA-binding response OmpR family regulator